MRILMSVIGGVFCIFESADKLSDSKSSSEQLSIVPGGQLNFRTGYLDTGIDPYGIYEDD